VIDKELSDKKCLEKRAKEFGKRLRDMYSNDNFSKYFDLISREIIDYCSNHS
jgi:peptidoglycan hydrolase CwlO-like protein